MITDNPFILHTPQYDCLADLSDEQLGQILRNLYLLRRGEETHFTDNEAQRAFKFIANQFVYDDQKRDKAKAQRKAAAEASVNARKRSLASANININSNRNINIKDNNPLTPLPGGTPSQKRFIKPTIQDVAIYAASIGYKNFEAEAFWDFYESKGWKVGDNPMKDWKAAARNWQRRRADNQLQLKFNTNGNNTRNNTAFEQRTMVCHDWSNERSTI